MRAPEGELGARIDVHEWATNKDSERSTDAAERVLRWIEKGGVPAGHWTDADLDHLGLLLTAADAGRRLDR